MTTQNKKPLMPTHEQITNQNTSYKPNIIKPIKKKKPRKPKS